MIGTQTSEFREPQHCSRGAAALFCVAEILPGSFLTVVLGWKRVWYDKTQGIKPEIPAGISRTIQKFGVFFSDPSIVLEAAVDLY